MRRGTWASAAVDGWPDNRSCEQLVAWTWTSPGGGHLIVVNLSDGRADGLVRVPEIAPGSVSMTDVLSGEQFERDGPTMATDGLYVALDPWGSHLLSW